MTRRCCQSQPLTPGTRLEREWRDEVHLVNVEANGYDFERVSQWVEREVQAAFEKERKQSTAVLLPVRLDNAVLECPQAWAAEIRRTRHIGDFRKWEDNGLFQKSLDRLIRDVKEQDSKPQ